MKKVQMVASLFLIGGLFLVVGTQGVIAQTNSTTGNWTNSTSGTNATNATSTISTTDDLLTGKIADAYPSLDNP